MRLTVNLESTLSQIEKALSWYLLRLISSWTADENVCRTEFPWKANCRRGLGRLWEIDSDLFAETLARVTRAESLFQRMELLGARQSCHQQRQKARVAHTHHFQSHSRNGFC